MDKKYLKYNLGNLILITILVSFFTIIIGLAWTEPTSNPPYGNVAAPLNVGSTGQVRAGGLLINQNGASIGLIVATGTVGIGTLSPGYKLDIAGDLRLQPISTSTGANGVIYYNSSLDKFQCYQGGAWTDCLSNGGIPTGALIAFPDTSTRTGFVYTGAWERISTPGYWWTNETPMPTARGQVAVTAAVDDSDGKTKIYVMGGSNDGNHNEAYDPLAHSWTIKAPIPTARGYLAAAAVNVNGRSKIYAIGGGANGSILKTNEVYDTLTNTWTTETSMPTARDNFAAVAVNGKIYAIGGWDGTSYLSTNESFNPLTHSWTTETPMPTARGYLAAAAVGNTIYAIGGQNYYDALTSTTSPTGGGTVLRRRNYYTNYYTIGVMNYLAAVGSTNIMVYLDTNEAYDTISKTWTTKTPMPTARRGLAAAAVDGIIYAIGGGGFNSGNVNEAYNPTTNTWTTKDPMPTARDYLGAAAVGNTIYVLGGYGGGTYLSTNEAFEISSSIFTIYWFKKL